MCETVMRYILLFIGFCLCACDPCQNLDCATDDYDGQFRFVRAATGNDLLFGPTAEYTPSDIRFFTQNGTDTTFFNSQAIYAPGNGYDSVLQVQFLPDTDTAYLQVGTGAVDTLHLQFKTTASRCCGTITEITNFRLNNSVDLPGKGTQVINK